MVLHFYVKFDDPSCRVFDPNPVTTVGMSKKPLMMAQSIFYSVWTEVRKLCLFTIIQK